MIAKILSTLFGTANDRRVKELRPIVEHINGLEPVISALTDEELTAKTAYFRELLSQGKTLNDILPEAFAVVRETSKRTLGQRHFDVQLMGGIILHQGKIAEMKTGEGKTLTAVLPLYLNALAGRGAHLVTVNDYLARRDAEWMSPIYTHLGLTVGIIQNNMRDHERAKAYGCDIVYGTNSEFGFDYLRDNMKFRAQDYVQRDLAYAIVDEVDSILIDEARTPLIISGATDDAEDLYVKVDAVVARLQRGVDYEADEKFHTVNLTEVGTDKVEAALHVKNLYAIEHMKLLHHVNQALRAYALYNRDREYVVIDNEVLIVDEHTGRILPGRRYSDGLHQALEAKERVEIEQESQTLASITLQNFFRLYKKLAGMTGTAMTEAEELYKIYKLDVVSVPTNRQMIRQDKPDLIFLSKEGKYRAIIEDISERYKKRQPVLIGTIAVETSELMSNILKSHNLAHEVLNAKNHAREADIVAHAGEPGRITIATNMAGRGTDIKLTPESVAAGGLYILGTERHESRRIDNQLRGRSGRQGDPGESRFYISLDDDLIRIHLGQGDTLKKRLERVGMRDDEVIESSFISGRIEYAQSMVERRNFEQRRQTLEYDDVLNQHRTVIYQIRRDILEGETHIDPIVRDMISGTVQIIMARVGIVGHHIESSQVALVHEAIHVLTGLDMQLVSSQNFDTKSPELFELSVTQFLQAQYSEHRNKFNPEDAHRAEKWFMLETIDQAWKQHMLNMDHLKEGIGLRGWGQKNPLIEYKREAYDMFREMMDTVRAEIVHHIFHMNLERFDAADIERRREREMEELNFSSPETVAAAQAAGHGHAAHDHAHQSQVQRSEPKVGRNDNCPCGSGKKFKKCHQK